MGMLSGLNITARHSVALGGPRVGRGRGPGTPGDPARGEDLPGTDPGPPTDVLAHEVVGWRGGEAEQGQPNNYDLRTPLPQNSGPAVAIDAWPASPPVGRGSSPSADEGAPMPRAGDTFLGFHLVEELGRG